jgi:Domain of Unknown Function (DUF349)
MMTDTDTTFGTQTTTRLDQVEQVDATEQTEPTAQERAAPSGVDGAEPTEAVATAAAEAPAAPEPLEPVEAGEAIEAVAPIETAEPTDLAERAEPSAPAADEPSPLEASATPEVAETVEATAAGQADVLPPVETPVDAAPVAVEQGGAVEPPTSAGFADGAERAAPVAEPAVDVQAAPEGYEPSGPIAAGDVVASIEAVEQIDLPEQAVPSAPTEVGQAALETAAEVSPVDEASESPDVTAMREASVAAVAEAPAAESAEAAAPVAAEPEGAAEPPKIARLEERAEALAVELEAAPNRATYLGRVRRLLSQVPEDGTDAQAVALRVRLAELEAGILAQVEERRAAKEAIVVRAEELAGSSEWKATGEALRGLFEQWKAIGSAGHEVEDPLWQRFQGARDTFSQRRNEWFEGRQKEWAANREKKEALCGRAEEMSESTEWRSTADAMRNLMAEWKTVGSAGRESDDALWSRFRAAQQLFFDRRSATYDENRRRKDDLCTQAEALKDSSDWRATADAMKGLQAGWKEVGPVGNRDLEDALWTRFRAATQTFFDRRGATFAERDQDERENLRRKEELCAAAEALAVAADPVAATEEAKALQAEWKTIGPVRRDRGDALWGRFRAACDRVFENAVDERARRQVAWSTKMRDALLRKEEQLARMQDAIAYDESTVERWKASLATRPDDGLVARIASVEERIREKRTRANELKSSIDDIMAKMK